jgi:hypothetical protein
MSITRWSPGINKRHITATVFKMVKTTGECQTPNVTTVGHYTGDRHKAYPKVIKDGDRTQYDLLLPAAYIQALPITTTPFGQG